MDNYKRKIFCENTTSELEEKLNNFEKHYIITDLDITVTDSNSSPSGVLFLASVVYKEEKDSMFDENGRCNDKGNKYYGWHKDSIEFLMFR